MSLTVINPPPVIDFVKPVNEPPTVFNTLLPNALATCDVIISATKPNNDDEPFDIN